MRFLSQHVFFIATTHHPRRVNIDLFAMDFSEETTAVLAYLDEYTGNTLRKRSDLAAILETASTYNAAEEFNALTFMGKVVWNLYGTLKKMQQKQEGYLQIEQEFATTVHSLREQLALFVSQMQSEEIRQRINEIYLGVGQGTMRNVIDLAHDLACLKNLQSEQER